MKTGCTDCRSVMRTGMVPALILSRWVWEADWVHLKLCSNSNRTGRSRATIEGRITTELLRPILSAIAINSPTSPCSFKLNNPYFLCLNFCVDSQPNAPESPYIYISIEDIHVSIQNFSINTIFYIETDDNGEVKQSRQASLMRPAGQCALWCEARHKVLKPVGNELLFLLQLRPAYGYSLEQ